MTDVKGVVYLLHFSRPFYHACHYLGWTQDLDARIDRHTDGHGAKIVAAAARVGIYAELVRFWIGTRKLERALKNKKCATRLCPLCKEAHREKDASRKRKGAAKGKVRARDEEERGKEVM